MLTLSSIPYLSKTSLLTFATLFCNEDISSLYFLLASSLSLIFAFLNSSKVIPSSEVLGLYLFSISFSAEFRALIFCFASNFSSAVDLSEFKILLFSFILRLALSSSMLLFLAFVIPENKFPNSVVFLNDFGFSFENIEYRLSSFNCSGVNILPDNSFILAILAFSSSVSYCSASNFVASPCFVGSSIF